MLFQKLIKNGNGNNHDHPVGSGYQQNFYSFLPKNYQVNWNMT